MIAAWLAGLEDGALATALRTSVFVYPLVNAAHVFGVALLVGAIVPLDLRLAGLWSAVPASGLWRVLGRMALIGFFLAAASGMLLFISRATEYAESPLFLAKLAVIVLASVNAIWLARHRARPGGGPRPRLRNAAIGSLILWLGALVLGRLVGYF